MDRRIAIQHSGVGAPLWALSLAAVVFASAAVVTMVLNPKAIGLALAAGLVAVLARSLFVKMRNSAHVRAETSSSLANVGLVVSGFVLLPIIAFAVVWMGLLLLLGVTWVLHVLHLA